MNAAGLFSELIAANMSQEACKIAKIVSTLSMLLTDPNQRSLRGIDLLCSFEYKHVAFQGPIGLSRHIDDINGGNINGTDNATSNAGVRGFVSINSDPPSAAAVQAIKTAILLDGNFDGSTSLPNVVGSKARSARGFATGFKTRCSLLASSQIRVNRPEDGEVSARKRDFE